jgi:hypothetical protein
VRVIEVPEGTLPNFLIIGAQKSGTSSLAYYLAQHPEVFIPASKELHFFDRPEEGDIREYVRLFAGHGHRRAVGEATANYLYFDFVAPRLASVLTGVRLVAVLRNPVDRAYSHYWMNRSLGVEPLSFRDAVRAESERLARGDWEATWRFSYLDRGRYERQLRNLDGSFRQDDMHVLLFDDLRDHVIKCFSAVCRFIGVDASFAPPDLGTPVTPHVAYRSLAVRRFAKGHFSKRVNDLIGHVNARPSHYPALDDELRDELCTLFEEDNRRLSARLSRDLSSWGSTAATVVPKGRRSRGSPRRGDPLVRGTGS